MSASVPSLAVACVRGNDARDALRRARLLGLAYAGTDEAVRTDLSLVVESGALWIRDNRRRGLRPLRADFQSTETRSRKQPLGRAVGRRTASVADATAGWGHDARRLCAMGYAVTAIERNPVVAALLTDAADRATRAGRADVPVVVAADSIEFLGRHCGRFDCVYLDPMFPAGSRPSALTRRPLRLLREMVGDDVDCRDLFEAARLAAAKRVVIKRLDHAAPLFGRPDEVMEGKLVCYDVYHRRPAPGC